MSGLWIGFSGHLSVSSFHPSASGGKLLKEFFEEFSDHPRLQPFTRPIGEFFRRTVEPFTTSEKFFVVSAICLIISWGMVVVTRNSKHSFQTEPSLGTMIVFLAGVVFFLIGIVFKLKLMQ